MFEALDAIALDWLEVYLHFAAIGTSLALAGVMLTVARLGALDEKDSG